VTARVNWQEWHLDDEQAFEIFMRHLQAAAERFSMEVLAYVVMSNHYHTITRSPPERRYRELTGSRSRCRHLRPYPKGSPRSNVVGQFVRHFHLATARSLQGRLGVKGHLWEEKHHRRRILDARDLVFTMAYDHFNLCKAGWSTVRRIRRAARRHGGRERVRAASRCWRRDGSRSTSNCRTSGAGGSHGSTRRPCR